MFYLINKHKGLTSFWVIHLLRKKLGIKKIGHTGTLDPLATGLLLIATGSSTRLIPYLEKENKTYEFHFNIDGYSDTGDLEGEVIYFDKGYLEQKKQSIDIEKIQKVMNDKFSGKIKQIPPKYSAIKINGKKAYDLVRSGKEFEMKERDIEIFESELISYDFPTIKIRMRVSAGTYIRTIAEDIGKAFGLNGYVTYLHRTKIGHIDESMAKHVEDIEPKNHIKEEILFRNIGTIKISEQDYSKMLNGKDLELDYEVGNRYFLEYDKKCVSFVEATSSGMKYLVNNIGD